MHRDIVGDGLVRAPAILGGRSVVVVIGINDYEDWPKLSNAVADAVGIRKAFERIGFKMIVPPLLDREATGDAMRRLVADDLATLSPNDRLVVFFAGHGHTHTVSLGSREVKTGFVIPVDGARPGGQVATWLRLDGWLSDISRLPPRHILVIIDACHSGIALGSILKWRNAVSASGTFDQLQGRLSRRVITSALDNQQALDSGPVPQHSLFTGCLIEGLNSGLAAERNRSYATGSEIALYVQNRVSTYPGSRQTPDFGALELDERGEMIVPLTPPLELAPMAEIILPSEPSLSDVGVMSQCSEATSALSSRRLASHPPIAWFAIAGIMAALFVVVVMLVRFSRRNEALSPVSASSAPMPSFIDAGVDAGLEAILTNGARAWVVGGKRRISAYDDFAVACLAGSAVGCQNAMHALPVVFESATALADELARLAGACPAKEAPCVAMALEKHDRGLAIRSCMAGVPTACLIASWLTQDTPADGKSAERAITVLSDDMIDARFLRSFLLASGVGGIRDPLIAGQLASQGCDSGDVVSCRFQQCFHFDGDAKQRMIDLISCQRTGVLSIYQLELARRALTHEVLQ